MARYHEQVDLHYNGFCNSVLWQLFHYVPLNIDSKLSETRTLQVPARRIIPMLSQSDSYHLCLPVILTFHLPSASALITPGAIGQWVRATGASEAQPMMQVFRGESVWMCVPQFQWAAHQAANQKFGEVVLRNYCAGDVVWVQDYHLMLLPAILKSRMPKMKARRPAASPLCMLWHSS